MMGGVIVASVTGGRLVAASGRYKMFPDHRPRRGLVQFSDAGLVRRQLLTDRPHRDRAGRPGMRPGPRHAEPYGRHPELGRCARSRRGDLGVGLHPFPWRGTGRGRFRRGRPPFACARSLPASFTQPDASGKSLLEMGVTQVADIPPGATCASPPRLPPRHRHHFFDRRRPAALAFSRRPLPAGTSPPFHGQGREIGRRSPVLRDCPIRNARFGAWL